MKFAIDSGLKEQILEQLLLTALPGKPRDGTWHFSRAGGGKQPWKARQVAAELAPLPPPQINSSRGSPGLLFLTQAE